MCDLLVENNLKYWQNISSCRISAVPGYKGNLNQTQGDLSIKFALIKLKQ